MSRGSVRRPTQAGRFYSANEKALREEIEGYIDAAPSRGGSDPPVGFVSPHAGYQFSGPTAGHVYRQMRDAPPQLVVVLAPSHHASFPLASLSEEEAYATPLGQHPIDQTTIDQIRRQMPGITYRKREDQLEHALEVQVPFLQVACPDSKLVPILVGSQDRRDIDALSEGLSAVCRDMPRGRVAFVASSDAYHGYSLEECGASDKRLAADIAAMDVDALYTHSQSGKSMACGLGPIATVMEVSRRLGAGRATILHQATSADAMPRGPRDYVVGYIAAMFD